jgi:polyphosphate kinase
MVVGMLANWFRASSGDRSRFYLGSADLMPRNLDHRIEILVPVEDTRGQQLLTRTFDSIMQDSRQSWVLGADGAWRRVRMKKGERGQSLHGSLMRRARARARQGTMSVSRSR